MTEFNQACPCCCAGGISEERERELAALLRRDWAVRVLDAYCSDKFGAMHWVRQSARYVAVVLWPDGKEYRDYPAATETDARLIAARAAYPRLSDAKRAELGECP